MIVYLIISILFLWVMYSWIRTINGLKKINASGPFPLPIVGSGHLLFGDSSKLMRVLSRFAKDYDGVCKFNVFSYRYVAISHPKYLEPLLSSSELIDKGRLFDVVRPWIGDSLVAVSGAKWKEQRKLLTPAFHFNILQSFVPVFTRNEKIFRRKLENLANGTPFDITKLIKELTFDNITESVMGTSFNAQTQAECKYLAILEDLMRIMTLRVQNPLLASDFIFRFSPLKAKMESAIRVTNEYSTKVIKSKRKILMESDISTSMNIDSVGMKSKLSFLDLLLLASLNGERLNDEDILGEVNTFMFAGHDTVSTTMKFTAYCISTHEAVQDKLLEEQMNIFDGDMERDPTYQDLMKMKYLDLVIKESLRLYPPAPMFERLITKDVDLAGLHLPKDTLVFGNIFEVHRNPEVFTNPTEFIPERYEDESKSAFSWIPFSAGPRNCIGQKYAMLQLKTILSSMVKHFVLLPSKIEPIITSNLILTSSNGVNVSLLPRKSKNII